MKLSLHALTLAVFLGAAAAAPAQALGPAPLGVAPDAPVTQTSAARERRLMIMRNMMAGQRRGHGGYGYGGPRGGYGYGRPHRGYGYGGGHRGGYGGHHRGGW